MSARGDRVRRENRRNIEKLKLQIRAVPAYVAASAANFAFEAVVLNTHQDSGQAAAQWYMTPYTTNYSMTAAKTMWGIKDRQGDIIREPEYPVGFKYDKGANAGQVVDWLLQERTIRVETMAEKEWNGVIVYNPLTGTLPEDLGSQDTSKYAETAFRDVDYDNIVRGAMTKAYDMATAKFSFIKRRGG